MMNDLFLGLLGGEAHCLVLAASLALWAELTTSGHLVRPWRSCEQSGAELGPTDLGPMWVCIKPWNLIGVGSVGRTAATREEALLASCPLALGGGPRWHHGL